MPVAVTVLPEPTVADANDAPAAAHVTVSPPSTPVSEQPEIVAAVVWSYGLFDAVTAAGTVSVVMFAVAVALPIASVKFAADAPPSVMPVAVTVLPEPAADDAKVAPAAAHVTV